MTDEQYETQQLLKSKAMLASEKRMLNTIKHLIGTPYSASTKTTITSLTGFANLVGPDEAGTKDYQLYIYADNLGTVTGFGFTD